MFAKYKMKQKISADISMTPMIDIVFQLLTFFMITSTFIQTSSLNINLPQAKTSDSMMQQEQTITLYKQGLIEWNGQTIALGEIPTILNTIKDQNPNAPLTIQGDENISYGVLIEVMDHARSANIDKISLATLLKK